jgi:hypothetical protein
MVRRHAVGFYKDERGRTRPVTRRGGRRPTIFFPAKYKRYADIVRIDTPEAARLSVKQLEEEFEKAETREKKRRLKKMVVLAANRAAVMSNNPRVSRKERQEAAEVEKIYRAAAGRMKLPPR